MCQSLMFNSKRDPGTEISAREASLRRGSAKNKRTLVEMEITVSQSTSHKLLKYRRLFLFSMKTRSEVCPDVLWQEDYGSLQIRKS